MPIGEKVLRVEEGPAVRRELAGEILGQRLGRDDVTADRNDPAPQVRGDAVRIAIRGDEDVRAEDRSAIRLDDEPVIGLAPNRARPDALVELRPGPLGEPDEPDEPLRRMEEPPGTDDQPAVIGVRADLLAELVLGNRV